MNNLLQTSCATDLQIQAIVLTAFGVFLIWLYYYNDEDNI